MKGIKWFQQLMIVFLIGINTLVYCLQSGFLTAAAVFFTLTLMAISTSCLLLLTQAKKRRSQARLIAEKKRK
jgi:hypothetical protein